MNPIVEENQVSVTIEYNDELLDATSETESNEVDSAGPLAPSVGLELFVKSGLNKLQEQSQEYATIKKFFLACTGSNSDLANTIKLVAIHKNMTSSLFRKARADAFAIFVKSVAERNGGDANLAKAWYGASKKEICEILTYGFSAIKEAAVGRPRSFPNYICLSPPRFCFDSVLSSDVDEHGWRHLLLCRVILGKQELLAANSNQLYPSSEEFNTGVDNLLIPRKYIVWTAYMNSYIHPCYVVSFKAPSLSGPKELLEANTIKRSGSSWISYSTFIATVTRFLSPSRAHSLKKCYRDFQAKKITKAQMIATLKEIAGMHVVAAVIDMYKKQKLEELPARRGR